MKLRLAACVLAAGALFIGGAVGWAGLANAESHESLPLTLPPEHPHLSAETNDAIFAVGLLANDIVVESAPSDDLVIELRDSMLDADENGFEVQRWAVAYVPDVLDQGNLSAGQVDLLADALIDRMLHDDNPHLRWIARNIAYEAELNDLDAFQEPIEIVENDPEVLAWLDDA